MNFYNPVQQKKMVAASAAPSAVPNAANPNKSSKFGYLDRDMIGGAQWGTGASFQGAGRQAVLDAIKGGMTTANPEDYAGMDELRNYYRGALADLPGQSANQISSFNTQAQRGLANNLSLLRNANAGRGTLGTRQYAGAQGDIASRANQDFLNSLIAARADAITQAGKIGGGLGDIQNRNLDERQFQFGMNKSLADQILQLMNLDMGRDARLAQMDFAGDEADKNRQFDFWKTQHNTGTEALGSLAAMSDARLKTNIRAVSDEGVLSSFRKTQPYSYKYKDERFGRGERVSPMAQEMIENGMDDCVFETKDGLAVDYGKAMGRMFAAISALTREVDRLKGRA